MAGWPGEGQADVELRQLRYFVTVAEELHFGRAADRLHIAQPAVSQQVSRLERELGLRLFERSSRRVRLTPEGDRLLVEARATLAAADRVTAVAGDLTSAPMSVLRVGANPGLGPRLDRGLERLRQAHSHFDVELELVGMPVVDQPAAVARGELDMTLLRLAPPGDGFQVIDLWPEPLVAALPAGHPAAGRSAVRLRDLAALPLRLPARERDPLLRAFVLEACRDAGFEPRLGRPTGSTADVLLELANGSPGWALLHADTVPTSEVTRVAVLPVDPPLTTRGCVVVPATRPADCVAGLRVAFGAGPSDG
ncbi:DNA-binding transcriptional regulator, LysR family [Parafrankia irregularis]|uniref:DNA-binding transcriptional regulator, LysR family n=1 Tax=Parafrankia irregularis TaxID=795642 RepID=A0A0S4QEE9_9ACTN|nr:DNA-binding transcriptional regulator, LysR family [Parafrankia irregularis]